MCKACEESLDHLLLHYSVATKLWSFVWSMPRTVVDLLSCWMECLGSNGLVRFGKLFRYVLWCLWRERNARTFDDVKSSVLKLKALLVRVLYDWMAVHSSFSFSNMIEVLDLLCLRT